MPELASLCAVIGRVRFTVALSLDETDPCEPALISPPDLIEAPELEDDALGFRA
jgi:hypothetical protein